MKIGLVIVIIGVILLIIVGYFSFSSEDGEKEMDYTGENFENIPDSKFVNLETGNDVFNEIDSALNFFGIAKKIKN